MPCPIRLIGPPCWSRPVCGQALEASSGDAEGMLARINSAEAALERKDWEVVGAVLDGVCCAVAEKASAEHRLDVQRSEAKEAEAFAVEQATKRTMAKAEAEMSYARYLPVISKPLHAQPKDRALWLSCATARLLRPFSFLFLFLLPRLD